MTSLNEIANDDLILEVGDHFAEALRRMSLSQNQASHVFEVDNRTITRCAKGQKAPGPYLKALMRATLRNYMPYSLPYNLNGFGFSDALDQHGLAPDAFAAMIGVDVSAVTRHLNNEDEIPGVMQTVVRWLNDGARASDFAPKGVDLATRQSA